jgi:hypothetical protein|tara:strand:- start:90 stop:311 length:222 start_codon:yes stop_codon:yes gene_type:complete
MTNLFIKHFAYGLLFVGGMLGFALVGIELGEYIGRQIGNEDYGFLIFIGAIVLAGITWNAYGQAKISTEYNSK